MTKTLEYLKVVMIGALAITIGFSGPAIAQTVITNDDFYVNQGSTVPAFPNGGITTQQVKCDANDILINGSWTVRKRNSQDTTPDIGIISERFNTQPNGITRTYEVTIRNFGPDFVDLTPKVLCLDFQ